jgi:hypothetical protein
MINEPQPTNASLSTMWAINNFPDLNQFVQVSKSLGFEGIELNHQVNSDMLSRVNWDHNSQMRMASISADGQVLDPGGVLIPGPTSGVTTGTSLGGIQMAWSTYTNWQNDIYSANIASGNTAGPNTALSTGGPMHLRSDAAAGSSGYMLAYRSDNAD